MNSGGKNWPLHQYELGETGPKYIKKRSPLNNCNWEFKFHDHINDTVYKMLSLIKYIHIGEEMVKTIAIRIIWPTIKYVVVILSSNLRMYTDKQETVQYVGITCAKFKVFDLIWQKWYNYVFQFCRRTNGVRQVFLI